MSFDPEKITFFAKTDARGKNTPFGIKAKDRVKHVYVIGKTGMGKSTMLENMAVQDIQNGEGLAFIDPHGSAAETLLSYIPEDRVDDVLYFAPFDMEYPVSFNIMEDVGYEKRHLVVSGLMSVFEKIWVDAWSARMAYILQNTLMALLEYPDSTLLGVNRMLSDKNYRKKVVDNLEDPGVKSFWVDEFAKYNERYMQEAGDAIKNKIGQFTANPVIRNIVGQPKSSFDIRKMMDEKKIIIMNLSKGLIGETNANLLGSMLTTRIYLAAMSRADLSLKQMETMPNFYFYVDEFQSFANSTFANILSEARKYKLNLTIAHQYIEQMEEEVRDAVFGNVGTIVAFRVGPFDAEVLETLFAPRFTATDIVNLSFAQVYLTLMIDGIGSQPFSAVTLPPIEAPQISYRDVVIASSRKQFTHNRAEVEESIKKFHEPIVPERQKQTIASESRESSRGAHVAHSANRPSGENSTSDRQSRGAVRNVRETIPPMKNKETEVPRHREKGNQRQSSHERPKYPPRRGKRNDQNLSDLKSVLKGISSAEGSLEKSGVQKESEKTISETKQELKSIIKETLDNKPREAQPMEKPKETNSPSHLEKMVHGGNSVQQETSPPKNNVTAKELERMMRVTTSDKPPLR